jgi:hypothetical protein
LPRNDGRATPMGLSREIALGMSYSVMPGLVPGIHVVPSMPNDVDGGDKPGHDDARQAGSRLGSHT